MRAPSTQRCCFHASGADVATGRHVRRSVIASPRQERPAHTKREPSLYALPPRPCAMHAHVYYPCSLGRKSAIRHVSSPASTSTPPPTAPADTACSGQQNKTGPLIALWDIDRAPSTNRNHHRLHRLVSVDRPSRLASRQGEERTFAASSCAVIDSSNPSAL
jgi:hypothetical protein